MQEQKRRGAPKKKTTERKENFGVRLPIPMQDALDALAAKRNTDVSKEIRKAIAAHLDEARPLLNPRRIPVYGTVSCGPAKPADSEQQWLDMGDLYDALKIKDGDFALIADGTSMVSRDVRRHVPDRAYMVFRHSAPTENRTALVGLLLKNGEYHWTVKRHVPGNERHDLVTGMGDKVTDVIFNSDVEEARATAGLVTVLTPGIRLDDTELYKDIADLEDDLNRTKETRLPEPESEALIELAAWYGFEDDPQRFMRTLVNKLSSASPYEVYAILNGHTYEEEHGFEPGAYTRLDARINPRLSELAAQIVDGNASKEAKKPLNKREKAA